jgi:hypothetical protein
MVLYQLGSLMEEQNMKRPKQLPAVERKSTKCSSIPAGGNVGASGWLDTLGSIAQTAIPLIAGSL